MLVGLVRADGPADNIAETVRRIPKLGVVVSEADTKELTEGLKAIEVVLQSIDAKKVPTKSPLRADVLIFHKAVSDALKYQEFFVPEEINKARTLLKVGLERVHALKEGKPTWTTQTGLVPRGYFSKIDGSPQPFGLVIPSSYHPSVATRLDVWFHGRGEVLSEVNFIDERLKQPGQFTPANTIVLHPYGRYCNAFKFAGEVDVLEAIDAVKASYHIDDDRVSVRGFSMGGAACWQFAVHQTDRWFAAAPGAGFSETQDFLKVFQKETLQPTAYEQKLWHLYDCTDYAGNLSQLPTVAYSGELDSQKQAADMMEQALAKDAKLKLTHLIGPQTKHAYHPITKKEIDKKIDSLAVKGRTRIPREIKLVTYTLKYPKMHWATITAIKDHWERASLNGKIKDSGSIDIQANANVQAFALDFPAGFAPAAPGSSIKLFVNGSIVAGTPSVPTDESWSVQVKNSNIGWVVDESDPGVLAKKHDLQGPIDDAFMDSFVIVKPTGTAKHPKVQAWVEAELARAIEHWRRHFRGETQVIDDKSVTPEQFASSNLILWGDPASNAILAKIADKLPIEWSAGAIKVNGQTYSAEEHALILIYPNPLNPKKYVVLNSGFTFREYDYLNNARQVPKLPDWAVIDLKTPPNSRFAGKVVAADFFDEAWKLKPTK